MTELLGIVPQKPDWLNNDNSLATNGHKSLSYIAVFLNNRILSAQCWLSICKHHALWTNGQARIVGQGRFHWGAAPQW